MSQSEVDKKLDQAKKDLDTALAYMKGDEPAYTFIVKARDQIKDALATFKKARA